jgi:hypothetical protein
MKLAGASKAVVVVAIVYLAVFFALASGLVNAIIEGANARGAFILPSRSVQTIGETVVITFILFMGMGGALLLYQSGKSTSSKTQHAFLVTGFGIIGIALLIGYMLVNVKL